MVLIMEKLLKFELNEDKKSYRVVGCNKSAINVVVPETYKGLPVTTIGREAFYNCTSLKSVEMPKVKYVKDCAFIDCESLQSVEMPNVKDVGWGAFKNCKCLQSVKMPKVEHINQWAFEGCRSIVNIEIPYSCEVADNAFEGASAKAKEVFKEWKINKIARDFIMS